MRIITQETVFQRALRMSTYTCEWLVTVVTYRFEKEMLFSKESLGGSDLVTKCDSCDFMNCSPPGSSVHGISQTRILEWFAISFSRGSSWLRDWIRVLCIAGKFFGFFTAWATREGVSWLIPEEETLTFMVQQLFLLLGRSGQHIMQMHNTYQRERSRSKWA